MTHLLDTTWIVEYLRGTEHIVQRVQELQQEGLAVNTAFPGPAFGAGRWHGRHAIGR